QFNRSPVGADADGFQLFHAQLDHRIHEPVRFKLFGRETGDEWWEHDAHDRDLPRLAEYRFPEHVWFVHGARRVLLENPRESLHDAVRVHVITSRKYRDGRLYVWLPGANGRLIEAAGEEPEGI